MFFKKKKQTEQAESPSLTPMASSSQQQGQSVFAPGLNPSPAYIDFGFGQSAEPPPAPPKYSSVSDISAYPQSAPAPMPSTMDPDPSWEPAMPTGQPMPGGWTGGLAASPDAAAMPTLPEPAWPLPEMGPMDIPGGIPGSMPTTDWTPSGPMPDTMPSYSTGGSFEDYIPEPIPPAGQNSPAEMAWQDTPYPMPPINDMASEMPAFAEPASSFDPMGFEPTGFEPAAYEPMPHDAGSFQTPSMEATTFEVTSFDSTTFEPLAYEAPSQPSYEIATPDPFAGMPLPAYETGSSMEFQPEFPSPNATDAFQPGFNDFSEDEPTTWDDFGTQPSPATGDPMSMTPAAFLDSVNQQLYPSDPFSSGQSDLMESEQAFEEAAQYLFPETMGAPLEWSDEQTDSPFDAGSPLLGQNPMFEPTLDLGPSYLTEGAGFNDISSFEEEPAPFASFETPMAPPQAAMPQPAQLQEIPPAPVPEWTPEPALDPIANPLASSAAPVFPEQPDVTAYELPGIADAEPAFPSAEPSLLDDLATSIPTPPPLEPAWDEPAAGLEFPVEPSPISANPPLDNSFGLPDMPQMPPSNADTVPEFHSASLESAGFENDFTTDDDLVNAYELGSTTPAWESPLPDTVPMAEGPTAPQTALDYSPSDSWFSEEPESTLAIPAPPADATNSWDLSFTPQASVGPTPTADTGANENFFSAVPDMPGHPAEHPSAGHSLEHPDDDFYAVSFTLNELGELVPDTNGQPELDSHFGGYSDEPILPPLSLDDLSPPAPTAPQEPMASPLIFESAADAFAAFAEPTPTVEPVSPPPVAQVPTPEIAVPQPPVFEEPAAPSMIPPPEALPTAAMAATAAVAAQPSPPPPVEEPPQPRRIQPKPLMQRTPKAPAPPAEHLEAQWDSAPAMNPLPTPQTVPQPQASDLMLGDLQIISVCVLSPEKRLLIIHNSGVYALMGQTGVEQPQVSVLKVFDHNPIAYQNTFTAVEEGQAGHQGMYVVQVGTWHGIISTFQDKITLHTELG